MLATKVICPNCHKALKTPRPLAVGKRVLCKQCGATFAVQLPDVSTNTPYPTRNDTGMTSAATLAAPPAGIAALGEEPIPTGFSAGRILKIGLVAVVLLSGLLVIGGGSIAALIYAARKERPLANNTKPENSPAEIQKADPVQPLPPPSRDDLKPVRPGPDDGEPKEPVAVPAPPRLSPDAQERVNHAVEKGLAYIKQLPVESPNQEHAVGLASLRGLTLLECGVGADDANVQEVASLIRRQMPKTEKTYDVSLALLFLDRLGDATDRKHIQTLALRLVAGQQTDGGWNYLCNNPKLDDAEEKELLGILEQARPRNPLELFIDAKGRVSPEFVVPRPGEKLPEFVVPQKGSGGDLDGPSKKTKPGDPKTTEESPRNEQPKDIAKLLQNASPKIKNLPGLRPAPEAEMIGSDSDNSNTQFAILAVWVASRHNIPMERTLALIVKRFRTSQDKQGHWGYNYSKSPSIAFTTEAMTCAGLLGLGAGYGMTAEDKGGKPGVQDKAVLDGFKALERAIDKSMKKGPKRRFSENEVNLYFLWSLERVGVMYNITNIGEIDWYRWGAEAIVDHQQPDGSWVDGSYPGGHSVTAARVDTCFALLFLKRANLAKDLSKKLEYIIDIKGVGNK